MADFYQISTLQAAADMVMRLVHEDDSHNLGLQDVKFWLNESEQEMLAQKYYPFLNGTRNFVQAKDTILDADIGAGDTTFDVADASDLDFAGTILINNNFIQYTGNDEVKTLSGVTDVFVPHLKGSQVKQIYKLDTDLAISQFDKTISLTVGDSKLEYYDSREGFNETGYTFYLGYLVLPYSTKGETVVLKYKKGVGMMIADTDEFTTPAKYIGAHINYAVYQAKITLNDPTFVNNQREYLRLRSRFKSDYSTQTDKTDQFVSTPYH